MITSVAVSEVDRLEKIFLPEMIIVPVHPARLLPEGRKGRISSFRRADTGTAVLLHPCAAGQVQAVAWQRDDGRHGYGKIGLSKVGSSPPR
jgi:hypothetical protein